VDTLISFLPEALAAVALVGGIAGGFALRRRRRPGTPSRPQPYVDYAPGVGDDAEVPRDTPRRTVESIGGDLFGSGVPDAGVAERPAPEELLEADAVSDSVDELTLEGLEELTLESPEPVAGRLQRLRSRLARSNTLLGQGLLSILSRGDITEADWDEIEETLLLADLGVAPTQELMERLRRRVRAENSSDPQVAARLLSEELLAMVDPGLDRSLVSARHEDEGRPAVMLIVGVNGTGKTTTTGKLARVLVAQGHTVVLAAADTFRAAAADQLQTWGERVGAAVVRGAEGADSASVAFEAVDIGTKAGVDCVVVDTAGRLHTKAGLMDELGKVKRVVEKHGPVDEVLLVIDATTGQNGLVQARVFSEVVAVTGIVLTKLDGTAKGGIVVAVQRELGVPVKLVGLGEGADDLAPFDARSFVEALIAP
jgi:fused signal recognition particle receptor